MPAWDAGLWEKGGAARFTLVGKDVSSWKLKPDKFLLETKDRLLDTNLMSNWGNWPGSERDPVSLGRWLGSVMGSLAPR